MSPLVKQVCYAFQDAGEKCGQSSVLVEDHANAIPEPFWIYEGDEESALDMDLEELDAARALVQFIIRLVSL